MTYLGFGIGFTGFTSLLLKFDFQFTLLDYPFIIINIPGSRRQPACFHIHSRIMGAVENSPFIFINIPGYTFILRIAIVPIPEIA